MLPDFVIIGAMKGGTSSLYRYISSHPDVVSSSVKETDFFKSDNDFNKGLDWYKSLFDGENQLAFEASPNYTKRHLFPGVPGRMQSVLPNLKLIYLLRDPIERVVSHYIHNYSKGRESLAFSEAIKDPESNYIQTSRYHFQIQAFLEYYPKEQLLLIDSERLRKDPGGVLREVFRFLEMSPQYDADILQKRFYESSKKRRQSQLESVLESRATNRYVRASVRFITSPFRTKVERPVVSPLDCRRLSRELSSDIQELRRFSGLRFSSWSL